MESLVALLGNYRNLVTKVDSLCASIGEALNGHITCQAGCDSCCRHLTLFPVEAYALAEALHHLPRKDVEQILNKAGSALPGDPCPLLEQGVCLLYAARPIICRTHGLPILAEAGKVSFCPLNFTTLPALPGSAIIDTAVLNTSLTAVNALFISQAQDGRSIDKERFSIAEALLLEP
jgi:uncharacterized protein